MANHGNDLYSSATEGPAGPPRPEMAALSEPPREHVGLLLKKEREKVGQSARDVAEALNIRYVYIQALEAGDYDKLPGKAYATGFLRTYAQHIGLDIAEIVRRFKEEEAGSEFQAQLVFPTPVPEGKVPGGALILVSILFVGLVAYGARSYFAEQETAVAELVPPVPAHLQNLVEEDDQDRRLDLTAERPAARVVTSPVFVLPKPGEEDGSRAVEPVETAAAMPAPTILEPPLEPVLGTASDLGAGDQGAAPAAEPAEESAVEEPEAATTEVAEPAVSEAPADQGPTESAQGDVSVETIPSAPIIEPGLTTSAGRSAPVEQQLAAVPEASEPAAIPAAPEPAPIPAAPTTEAPAEATEDQAPRTYGEDNSDARIVLRAIQDSWVQVRDVEDSLLLTRLLRAGDSYRVPNRGGLRMLTGNAGGLEVEVDGTSLGPLGPVGKVRRDVSLDAERLIKSHNLAQ